MSQKRELGAIVFTDISDFTSMMDKDESKALKIRHKQRDSIQSILKDFDGEYIKEIGDGDLMMFQSATDAVHFTLKLQNTISPNDGFLIRAAIHIGDVVREGEDIFGSGVNMASRIHAFASPGSTVISESVFQEIKNKSEFSIASLGKKSVKGIDESIQIHEVSLLQENTNKDTQEDVEYVEKSVMNDLFERRIPQFIGLYFAISWGIIQFINWIVDRYLLSPHLVDLSLAIAISMLPSMLILSYFHGRPGKDRWNRVEKIVVPANFIIATIILFVFFYPKNLGAVTEDVTITNEDGTEFTKTIVKSEFRKTLNIFNFKNILPDTSNNWMNKGIRLASVYDLKQDLFITSKSGWAAQMKNDIGYASKDNISLGDMQKISKRTSSEFFITGEHSLEHGVYTLNFKIYKTSNAKLIDSHEYRGNNFFELIDLATIQIKQDIEIPSTHIENTKDLPVEDRLTNSMDALKHLTISSYHEIGFEKSFYHLNEAIKYDEEFALAHAMLYSFCLNKQDMECFSHHMGLAKKYINKLDEGTQFGVRIDEMDVMNPNIDRKLNLINMWIELYPDDIRPLEYLAHIYLLTGDMANVISTQKKILRIDPSKHELLLEIGSIYKTISDYDNALTYYNQYQKSNPNNPEGYQLIASVYMVQLDYDNAYNYMLKAQAVGATGPDFELQLTNLNAKLDNWSVEQYVKEIERIIEENPEAGFQAMIGLYNSINLKLSSRGRVRDAIPHVRNLAEYGQKQLGPGIGAIFSIDAIDSRALLGDTQGAEEELNNILNTITVPPLSNLTPLMRCCYYSSTKNWDKFNENLKSAHDGAIAIGFNFMLPLLDLMSAEYFESIGDTEKVTELNMKVVNSESLMGNHMKIGAYISQGRVYQELGLLKKSEKMFETVIKLDDENAALFYEYSLLKEKQGNMKEALDLILKAYNLYKDGDKELELTQKIFKRFESFQQQLP